MSEPINIRDTKNLFVSEETLFDKEGKLLEKAVETLVKISKTNNLTIFTKSDEELLAKLKKSGLSFHTIQYPPGSDPPMVRAAYITKQIESSTFAVWVIDHDKKVPVEIYNTREFKDLVQQSPDSDISDGVICKWHIVETIDDWKKLESLHSDDTRAITIEEGYIKKFAGGPVLPRSTIEKEGKKPAEEPPTEEKKAGKKKSAEKTAEESD